MSNNLQWDYVVQRHSIRIFLSFFARQSDKAKFKVKRPHSK